MMDCKLLLLLTAVVGIGSAQKLFFKSNRLIQKELNQHVIEQVKTAPPTGFGFKKPRKYFTGHRTDQEMIQKVPAGAVVCPGAKVACPEGNTCCMTSTMAYGCCPLPLAMCCPDRRHCCPSRTKCDMKLQACISGEEVVPWYEKTSATSLETTNMKEVKPLNVGSVICGDGEHMCEDGQTCCKSVDGYSCCPLPNAVCCSDQVHCCPNGTKCDLPRSRCTNQETGEFFDWVEKTSKQKVKQQYGSSELITVTPAELSSKVESVKCDDQHVCPTGNTCCKMTDNEWGCCPKPEAACCDDKLHCCPKGSKCELKSGSCVNGLEKVEWSKKQPAILVDVKCDESHVCPADNTCCKLASGQWGCCPIPEAVCCNDHVHCCPHDTTCDTSSGKCDRGDSQIDWFVKQPAIGVGNVKCDETHECPTNNTCCRLSSGQWGCCPLREAVCCEDHVHCCPSGTTCNAGKCESGNSQVDWFVKQPAIQVGNVRCDDTHECPTNNTCCRLSSGQWGCCPKPEAVCCEDHVHCCPHGTTCDTSKGTCNQGGIQLDWFAKQPAIEVGIVICDSTHECPTGNTCCRLSSGQWGCCPVPDAVCCEDHVHCCPNGTTCDTGEGKCNRGDIQLDWFVKQPAVEVGNVKCDRTHECPTGNTCCKLTSGQWGCCPIPNAVCCEDHVHCCPSGTTCDTGTGKCNQGDSQIDWFIKQPALEVGNVMCDSTHECPSGNTCCKLSSGQWGCCPLPNAVCCSDGVHCCPDGTTCDTGSGKCNQGDSQIDWFVKQPALEVGNVMCDSTHECPSGNTCCKLSSGQWGCCPLPNAVCCSDGVHCCPDGTTCDTGSGKCNQGDSQIDWFVKQPALEVGNVMCDSTHECPSDNTCCKLSSGQWGCCPLPNAVCCSDGVHCCPDGTTCDTGSGKCNQGDSQIDWFVKQPALEVGNVMCDSTHECPSGNTCCKLSSGQWGCCPLPNAVCCSDGVHCCPDGTTCDTGSGKCNQGDSQIDWFVKQPALEIGKVVCDSTHECPTGNTCCKLSSGQWGCCPLPNAVCCSDHVHCCPHGTTCDTGTGKCNRGDIQLDWFVKQPAIEVGIVKCDETHECPSGNTCCKLSSGQWGCCPLPEAVCCSDGVHCCPAGTACDVSSGKCNRGNIQLDWFVKTPAIVKVQDVICPDGSECQEGQTCCEMNNGVNSYGCCPLPNVICCNDGQHCCPLSYKCDLDAGACVKGNIKLPWIRKRNENTKSDIIKNMDSKIHIKNTSLDISKTNGQCPDEKSCPAENSCCDNRQGGYICCPMPNAVCCNDGQHCCPHDYKCDVTAGACVKGFLKLPWIRTTTRNENTQDVKNTVVIHKTDNKIQIKNTKIEIHETDVKCSDQVSCDAGNTCCSNGQGGYNCCPMPSGVCCDDHQHCCPHGYICDEEPGTCRIPETNNAVSNFIKKLGSRKGIPLV